jgi:lysophospholipase L1-like esterase
VNFNVRNCVYMLKKLMQSLKIYMKLFLSIISIFFLLVACKKQTPTDNLPVYTPPPPAPVIAGLKYLALGDSYTIGESVPPSTRYPAQASALLTAQGKNVTTTTYVATTGWTTGNLISALNNGNYAKDYDVVTLLIGVNNQFQGLPLAQYKTDFTELLSRAIQYAKNDTSHVFVLSIPDYSVTPFAQGRDTAYISRQIDEFNAANKTITTQLGVTYIDITPISRQARTNQNLTAGDGLHPSETQYQLWTNILEPLMKAVL